MRKRLVALLSLAGLASSTTPATSQVLKGSSAGPETKNESTVKANKVNQENAAVQNDTSKKMRKAGGEQGANKDVVTEKVGSDHIVNKHVADIKYGKQKTESKAGKTEQTIKLTNADAASKDASKMTKATTEKSNAVKSDVGKKERKAGKDQQDALTVKQKIATEGNIKLQKNAAESKAAQKSADIKLQKQTDKATTK